MTIDGNFTIRNIYIIVSVIGTVGIKIASGLIHKYFK